MSDSTGNTPRPAGKPSLDKTPLFSSGQPGIQAVHMNSAREMVRLHTQGRTPAAFQSPSRPDAGYGAGSGRPGAAVSGLISHDSRGIGAGIGAGSVMPKPRANAPEAPPKTPTAGVITSPNTSSRAPIVIVPAKKSNSECKNPQCAHCGQVIIPSPKSSFPIQDVPSITVNDWSVYAIKKPILNAVELDSLAETKFSFPLPEMIFGNNSIQLVNEKEGITIEFNAIDALDLLEDSCEFKVSYHEEWLKSRRKETPPASFDTASAAGGASSADSSSKDLSRLTGLESLKPYDWTYSTSYQGTVHHADIEHLKLDTDNKVHIPVERLMRPDPILFFDEMVLFEDELGDNGISMLTVKIRVMPTCLLLLSRFFMRIDNVAFRVRDTRIFIDLETSEIIKEYKEQESPYDEVLRKVTGGSSSTTDPKGLLRDTNWVSQNIPVLRQCTYSNRK